MSMKALLRKINNSLILMSVVTIFPNTAFPYVTSVRFGRIKETGSVVLFLGDTHNFGSKLQNELQLNTFKSEILDTIKILGIGSQVLLEEHNWDTFNNFTPGSDTYPDFEIVKRNEVNKCGANIYQAFNIRVPILSSELSDSTLLPGLRYGLTSEADLNIANNFSWIFHDLTHFLLAHKSDYPTIRALPIDPRYCELNTKNHFKDTKSLRQVSADLFAMGRYPEIRFSVLNESEYSQNSFQHLKNLSKEWSLNAASSEAKPLIQNLVKNEGSFEDEKRELDKFVENVTIMTNTNSFDFEILVHLLKKKVPKLSVVVIGNNHARKVISELQKLDSYEEMYSFVHDLKLRSDSLLEGFITSSFWFTDENSLVSEVSDQGRASIETSFQGVKELIETSYQRF